MSQNQGFHLPFAGPPPSVPYLLSQRSGFGGRNCEVESTKEGMAYRTGQSSIAPQRLNQSDFYVIENRRNSIPFVQSVYKDNETYVQGLERAILQENRNIKQHNNFLKGQIKMMFERQKKYKGSLLASKQKIKELESINKHLQSQLDILFSNIIAEIQRIQEIVEEERFADYDDLLMISRSAADTPRKSIQFGSETESTIHHNLEDLKVKVNNMALYGQFDQPTCSEDRLKLPPPLFSHERHHTESAISNEDSKKDRTCLQIEREDLFDVYLPMNLIKNDRKQRDKRATLKKN